MREELVVHDVIRAKDRRMAGSTRIMDGEFFEEAIEEKRLKDIKGISGSATGSFVLEDRHLNSMRKSLRVLEWAGSFSGRTDKLFPKLKYVGLYGDTPHLPFLNLHAFGKLAVYEGPVFNECFSIYKLPKSLRVLRSTLADDIEDSSSWEESRPIQIVKNSSLQELHLADLWTITKLPEGFHCFVALQILNLARWYELEELPESVCGLESLTKLILCSCDVLKRLPSSFGKLTNLKYLDLGACMRLKELSSTFGQLKALEHLNLKNCPSLKELTGFEQLIALKYLNVQKCTRELRRNLFNRPQNLEIVGDEEIV